MQDHMLCLIRITMEDSRCSIKIKNERASESRLMGAHSNGEIISTTSDFQTFWKNVAGKFVSNELVIFDTSQ